MKSNLKVILSTLAIAALLASPAAARTNARHHSAAPAHHRVAPATVYVPNDAYGSAVPSPGSWAATHSGSWDATHDPRENPSGF
jgi:hypothetical protein